MKELNIKVIINEKGEMASAVQHKGFAEGSYTIQQILETIGILENLKNEQLKKLSSLGKPITKI